MHARIELPADATSPRQARRFATAQLDASGYADLADVAILLLTELVTNSVLHAGTPIEVTISGDGPTVRMEVADRSPVVPRPRRHSAEAVTGRGLQLVAELARDWGTEAMPGGKRVWFTLAGGQLAAAGGGAAVDVRRPDDEPTGMVR